MHTLNSGIYYNHGGKPHCAVKTDKRYTRKWVGRCSQYLVTRDVTEDIQRESCRCDFQYPIKCGSKHKYCPKQSFSSECGAEVAWP